MQKTVCAAGNVPLGGVNRERFARRVPVEIERADRRFGGDMQRVPGAVVDAGGAVAVAEDCRIAANVIREGYAVRDLGSGRLGRRLRCCGRFGRGCGRRYRRCRRSGGRRRGRRRLRLRRCAAGSEERAEQREYQKKRSTFFRGGYPFSRNMRGYVCGYCKLKRRISSRHGCKAVLVSRTAFRLSKKPRRVCARRRK